MNRKHRKRLLLMLLIIAVSVSFSFAYASGEHDYAYSEQIISPSDGATFYIGEKINTNVVFYSDTDKWPERTVYLYNREKDKKVWKFDVSQHITKGEQITIRKTIDTKKFKESKKYAFIAQTIRLFTDYLDLDYDAVDIKILKLKPPTNLKTTSGKGKVTISYTKAKGAKKYEIYRSTKKSSGYKKIATTTKTKYVDKKVSKGKRYYYKVRSYRSVHGTVRSSFSSKKRSGKVQ